MSGIMPPSAVKRVVHGVDRAAGGGGRDDGKERRQRDAEADLLALHVAAVRARARASSGLPRGFRPSRSTATPARNSTPMAAKIAQPWRWLPTMRPKTLVSAAPIAKIDTIWTKFDERVRVLERMRGVGVEEAAAIGAEHLDRELRGDRARRDRLLRAFERRRVDIGAERLRHAAQDVEQRQHDADRQQHVERGAGQIDPEIADRLARSARAKPRISATAMAMPVAAETKFCTVRPAICTR